MANDLNVLFLGDVVGENGLDFVVKNLQKLQEKYDSNFTVVNGENVWQGKGINEAEANQLFDTGVDVITTGNHIWENWKSRPLIASNKKVLRPLNYPSGNPGMGFHITMNDKVEAAVIQLQGRTFMAHIDCPFRAADFAIKKVSEKTNNIIVDFHADATGEKMAMGWYLDGKVSAMVGTHTHIPTADAQILPKGTAYITDVGMCGPHDSVIGMSKEIAIKRYILQTAHKYEVADDDMKINGVSIKIDSTTGQAMSIEHFSYPKFINSLG